MKSYTVLARKYRPQTFEELVGQEHVAKTLGNAIASGRVAHAFLFTGVRGVGKTSTARLLAKALNCETGATAHPCNACSACIAITAGNDIDVQEIDGASNNGVDDVRRLQETLPFRPSRNRYKIVIVDEVHMLSAGAFNAFLKTLEEPPDHVKFIFATTESHKVPVTIRSRCQRYDFRLIPQRVIGDRLRTILKAEGLTADDETVAIVAREAAGSMRDALTLLDQLVAFGGTSLVGHEVAAVLGIAGRKHVFDSAAAVLHGDAAAVLEAIHALAVQGADMLHFSRQLLELTRDLVVLSVASREDAIVELVEEERVIAKELVRSVEGLELQRAFAALSQVVEDVGSASAPRMALEMGLVRIATRPPLRSVQELLGRLTALERRIGSAGASSGGASIRQAPPKRQVRSTPPVHEPSAQTAPAPVRQGPPVTSNASVSKASSTTGSIAPTAALPEAWCELVMGLQDRRPALAAILEHGVPMEVSQEKLILGFPKGSFFAQQAGTDDALEQIKLVAQEVLGATPSVEIVMGDMSNRPTLAESGKKQKEGERREKRREALNHPGVQAAVEAFPEAASQVEVHLEGEH